jgi:hypothetical protein
MYRLGAGIQLRLMLLWSNVRSLVVAIVVLMVCAVGILLVYPRLHRGNNGSNSAVQEVSTDSHFISEIESAINAGQYDSVRQHLDFAMKAQPDNKIIQEYYGELMHELKLDFKFTYLPGRRREVSTHQISGEMILTKNDPYYLVVHATEKCYLYLFQLQSSGELTLLFPNSKYAPDQNPIQGGSIRIPDGYEWFYLDETPGIETIYLLASRWPQRDIETLSSKFESLKNPIEKTSVVRDILLHLQHDEQVTHTIPGLVFAKHQFKHELSS